MRISTKKYLSAGLAMAAVLGVGGAVTTAQGNNAQQRALNCSSTASDGRTRELNVLGLTADNRLLCFMESRPNMAQDVGPITGLDGDTGLVGIDVRPANNTLYGVGNAGGIYTIKENNAQATKVAQLSVALAGSSFGVDVNPAADALRIISETGQNLRFSFSAGTTTTDGPLAYPPNPATGVTGAGYTNNDGDPNTATTLFDVDSMLDQVAIQSPANSGQLAATGKLTLDTTAQVGFDVYSTIKNGTTVDLRARASLVVGGQNRFYAIDLLTGKADNMGAFKASNQVIGIAIPLNQL